MKIFGYHANGEQLLEMEEISIECELHEFDEVIEFLKNVRGLIDAHQGDFWHAHLRDWKKRRGSSGEGGADIVVVRKQDR